MKVMVYDPSAADCVRMASLIRAADHEVIPASEPTLALDTLSGGGIDVGLVTDHADALTFAQKVRIQEGGRRAHLLLMTKDSSEAHLLRAYESGYDAEIRVPCGTPLLYARLQAVSRSVQRARLEPLKGVARTTTPLEAVLMSTSWRDAKPMVRNAAGKFLSLPVNIEESVQRAIAPTHASQIVLASAQNELEVRVALGVDEATARSLTVHMFGPDNAELVDDMLCELANIFMGTLKTSLNQESFSFSAGLPERCDPTLVERPGVLYKAQEVFSLRVSDASVLVHVGVRAKANRVVKIDELREGMVVAKDIYNMRGALLLHCGTRLSTTMIERIKTAMPPKAEAEVAI